MIKLTDSNVQFDEDKHEYWLNGKQLSGITGLLHAKLFPHQYAGIPKHILDKAAERGTLIHKQTELYDLMGVGAGTSPEVDGYIRLRTEGNYDSVASEYIVTDGEHYASAIDAVWTQDGASVILVDKKTTSKYYAESVEWQLSIYAYLFEQMNPDIKVAALYGCWLRGDKAVLYPAKRHNVEEIKRLLQSGIDDVPFTPDAATISQEKSDDERAIDFMLVDLASIEKQLKALSEERDGIKARLMEKLCAVGQDKASNDIISVSRKSAGARVVFDSKTFKKDHADLYEQYITTSKVASSLIIKLKD